VLRGTNQQVAKPASALLWEPPVYKHRTGRDSADSAGSSQYNASEGIVIKHFELHNRAASAAATGIGGRIANRYWQIGTYDGTTFTDDTADAQNVTAGDFIMHGADAANDGFVILSPVKFGWVSFNVSQACTNVAGDADHTLEYSNAAGTGWTTLAAADTYVADDAGLITSNAVIAVGEICQVFEPPTAWGKVTSITGLPTGYYALRFDSAAHDAGDAALLATAVEIGVMWSVDQLGANGTWEVDFGSRPGDGFKMHQCDGLVAFFQTADGGNRVYADVDTA